jgi:hypothetical protein
VRSRKLARPKNSPKFGRSNPPQLITLFWGTKDFETVRRDYYSDQEIIKKISQSNKSSILLLIGFCP